MFLPHWRERAVDGLDEVFDLVIVGGGITGCGILLDAAQRGLRVLLVEKGDIASGTSSRSSKLIHGGLRYLKQMQFRITRRACRERDRMLSLNPDLVRPIRFYYPANHGDPIPGWTVDLGLWMYDRLTQGTEKHSQVTTAQLQATIPGLGTGKLERVLTFNDALADDAGLTLAVAATGSAHGGEILTGAEVIGATRNSRDLIRGVRLRDLESGREYEAHTRVVVNAAGVWVDSVREIFGLDGVRVRPSRGSHLILSTARLPITAAVTLPSPEDGRPVFLIPHPEGVLVGTTDLYHDGALDDPRPTSGEVDYLLGALRAHFPKLDLDCGDIVGAFAGLRPILDTDAETPSAATREEAIWEEHGMLSVAGGKLTTWRTTSEEVVDKVLSLLPPERADRAAPCHTAGTPLGGLASPALAGELNRHPDISTPVAAAMARRLRGLAPWAPQLGHSAAELQPILPGIDLCAAEVRTHLRFHAVRHLSDLLLRRVRVGMWDPETAQRLVPALRGLFMDEMQWDGARWALEDQAFADEAAGWTLEGAR